jgi:hypothetical protein
MNCEYAQLYGEPLLWDLKKSEILLRLKENGTKDVCDLNTFSGFQVIYAAFT